MKPTNTLAVIICIHVSEL